MFVRSLSTTAHIPQTSVAKGTAFEQRSLSVARNLLSMSLRRVGGKSDGGIDLTGWWWLPLASDEPHPNPHTRRRIRVLAQCKAEKKKIGPNYVREMEGVLYQYHHDKTQRGASSLASSPNSSSSSKASTVDVSVGLGLVALFISESPFTKSTTLRAMSSTVPFLLLHLPPIQQLRPSRDAADSSNGVNASTLGSVVMNRALSRLLGENLEVRWERNLSDGYHETDGTWASRGRPGVYWQGRKLESWAPNVQDAYDDPRLS
ncbi:hypothetical protein HDZ31DRAFT_62585 [Schizophyllum fasciatum]